MLIFQEDNHTAVKFFIQRDLPDDVRAELTQTILELGGRVEEKVPRQGYVLISLGTAEGQRLRECWALPDRPHRFFVPHTFVEACKIAGTHLRQIFVENGAPIPIHIHSSIANVNARNTLSERIMHSGGDPHATPQTARVVLADPNTEVFQALVKTYDGNPAVHVESYLWVKKCIEKGIVSFTPVVFKNPGGRRRGEERTQFNERDDELLCGWIASKIPYKEIGGRTGNRLYQQLLELSDEPEYSWVTRHTWQSWRERYKKNAERMDKMISAIVAETKPSLGEKGQYGYVREKAPKKKRKVKDVKDEEDLRVEMNELQSQKPLSGLLPPEGPPIPIAGPSDDPLHMHVVGGNGPEEELDDGEDEWAIRVGGGPPPGWAKRRASEGLPEGSPNKRSRLHEPHLMPLPGVHVIDQAICDIAMDFKFTVEEVQSYYDKCGEMGRTRERFGKMREMLTAHFSEDN
ncbi:hypothetical protein BDZ89DRAFT_1008374 [Hymenopellis radicata]|nr:hypothetical protein BDZ89DRAFT_1008374 [Hymenopellis radicata]